MTTPSPRPLSGRRAQAARNDTLILEAAREVFVTDPGAPIAAVARQAGVGISALYRRFSSKDDLLRRLNRDGLDRYIREAETALADERDPWLVFADYMRRVVIADTHSLTLRLAGRFVPTDDLNRDGARAAELTWRVLARAQAARVVRSDIEVGDLTLLFEQLAVIRLGDSRRTNQIRLRYLALMLDALHLVDAALLPGPPPAWPEIAARWEA